MDGGRGVDDVLWVCGAIATTITIEMGVYL